MEILAMKREIPGVGEDDFKPHLKAEAARVWELYRIGVFRELCFRKDRPAAALMMECADVKESNQVLETLPLVREGLIDFDVIPLVPYPGFARLFAEYA